MQNYTKVHCTSFQICIMYLTEIYEIAKWLHMQYTYKSKFQIKTGLQKSTSTFISDVCSLCYLKNEIWVKGFMI